MSTMPLLRRAAGWISSAAVLGLAAGCGSVPDVKVDAVQLAEDVTQLAVQVWKADRTPSQPLPLFTVPAGSTSYNFGLDVPNNDFAYIISVAEFAPNDAQKPCLRGTGTSVQAPGFPILSTVTVVLPKPPLASKTNCYDVLDVNQTAPLISNAIIVINRQSDMSAPTVVLLVQGWQFLADDKVTITQKQMAFNGTVTNTQHTPTSLSIDSPTQISLSFTKADLVWLESLNSQLEVSVVHSDGKSATATFPSFGQ